MNIGGREFREVWACDFEFAAPAGEPPTPVCMVAKELDTGRNLRLWQDDLHQLCRAPFATDAGSLVVAYCASAELGCFLSLGWPLPANVLDLYAEFRNATNGKPTRCGCGLLGALVHFGIDGLAVAEKDSMRQLALRGGPYTDAERAALIAYCESDVLAVEKLLCRMQAELDVSRALIRGRYMAAAARMEQTGTPIDVRTLAALRTHWTALQGRLVERIDADYGVFDGRTFTVDRWAAYLTANRIPWPRLSSGALALDDDTFREMSRAFPAVAPIRELRYSLSQLRLESLAVGRDGRNRCILSAFRSKTGRNQPSNAAFIFGPAVWLRGLILPEPGMALAYIDWSQQEFGIAAALSGDPAMLSAYESGDPYLAFGKQAGLVPVDGTKATHAAQRELCKACVLGTGYGMGADSLAARIGHAPAVARELLRKHRAAYRRFWSWSDGAVSFALLRGSLPTVLGWTVHVSRDVNPRSLANFPMQANGAEMLRLACIAATERGIRVCAPVHDAMVIEAPTDRIWEAVGAVQSAMSDASALVLGGFRLRTDARVFAWPGRYMDERGRRMWGTVCELLGELEVGGNRRGNATPTHAVTRRYPRGNATPSHLISMSYVGVLINDGPPGPGSFAPSVHNFVDPDPIETTAETQGGRAIPERADPVAVASDSGDDRRSVESLARRSRPVVPGGNGEIELREAIPFDSATAGRVTGFIAPGADDVGASWSGAGGPQARMRSGGDDSRMPGGIAILTLNSLRLDRGQLREDSDGDALGTSESVRAGDS